MSVSPQVLRRRRVVAFIAAGVAVVLVALVAIVVVNLIDLNNGLHRAQVALPTGSVPQNTGEVNILVMGLDSRVDENGNPYPQAIYNAIHAEDASVGGYNANVLMYIHIPGGGGPAVGISIPRDDYVRYAGTPGGVAYGKIKEAYGREFAAKESELLAKGMPRAEAYQKARDAGREEQLRTVSQFLGGVPIDHFVEVTMAAFYEVAKAVQPVEVCLNHATADTFSGADFRAGVQQIDAAQAMAFVRQRRDTRYAHVFLTDLDRTRRQQAFIVSLALKLRDARTFTDFGTMRSLIDTAKQYTAVDAGFDLLSLASDAQRLAGGHITFETLPIERFGYMNGESVNIVDQQAIARQVAQLLHPAPTPSATPTHAAGPAPSTPTPTGGPTTRSYTDSQQPMPSGAVPCVN